MQAIKVTVHDNTALDVKLSGQIVPADLYERYNGDYAITPGPEEQTLETGNKLLTENLHIEAVDVTATATPDKVVEGYTFFADSLERKTGNLHIPEKSVKTVTGEGSVIINDAVKSAVPNAVFYGACKQKTYTGKNLTDPQIWLDCNCVIRDDGTVYIDSPFKVSGKNIWENTNGYTGQIAVSMYYRTPNYSSSSILGVFLRVYYTDGTKGDYLPGIAYSDWKYVTSVSSSGKTVERIVMGFASGAGESEIKNLQIERGNAVTSYEPYTGSVPSPSEAYPQTIYPNNAIWQNESGETVDLSALSGGGLCAVGEAKDEWDSSTGEGIRRTAVISSYNGEMVGTNWISSTGVLTTGAAVIYEIPEQSFTTQPQKLTTPEGDDCITQISGDIENTSVKIEYVTRR